MRDDSAPALLRIGPQWPGGLPLSHVQAPDHGRERHIRQRLVAAIAREDDLAKRSGLDR